MTMVTPDVRADAEAEARRLAWARALTRGGDDDAVVLIEGDRPWLTMARGWRTRRALGLRVALVWRLALHDAAGSTVESRLIAIAIRLPDARRECLSRRSLEQLVRHLEPAIQAEIVQATASWQQAAEETGHAFTSARKARSRAIVEHAAAARVHEFQPGLFDRRAERARDQRDAEAARAAAAAPGNPAAMRSCEAIGPPTAQLLLLLGP